MKTLINKKQERTEKKKRKLAALANLVKLNDKERQEEVMAERKSKKESTLDTPKLATNEMGNNDNDGFTMVRN